MKSKTFYLYTWQREQDGSEGLPHEEHNPSNCPEATMPMCSFLAGDVRSSEQGILQFDFQSLVPVVKMFVIKYL